MKRRARLSGEKLIMDYLGRVTEAGLYYLPKGSRAAFVGRTKAQIERECGPAGLADAARVMEVLAGLGDPEELVRQERARIDAAWIKTTFTDRNLAQAAAAAINTPRKYRSITSRWKPATDTQPLPRPTDAKSMSAPIGKMHDAGDPFTAGKKGERQPEASPGGSGGQPTPAAEPGSGPAPAAEPGAGPAPTGEPGAGPAPTGEPGAGPAPTAEPSAGPAPAAEPGSGSAGQAPGAQGPGEAPGTGGHPGDQGGQALRDLVGSVSKQGPLSAMTGSGTASATASPGSAKPAGDTPSTPFRSAKGLASRAARLTSGRLVPGVVQLSRTAAVLAREHVREAIAIAVLGVGGLIAPYPLWLVGAVIAVTSPIWDRRDKWIAFAGPVVIALIGAGVAAGLRGGSENAVVVYVDALTADIGLLLRFGCLLTAAFLAWRLHRDPREKGKKPPPWERYGR